MPFAFITVIMISSKKKDLRCVCLQHQYEYSPAGQCQNKQEADRRKARHWVMER